MPTIITPTCKAEKLTIVINDTLKKILVASQCDLGPEKATGRSSGTSLNKLITPFRAVYVNYCDDLLQT